MNLSSENGLRVTIKSLYNQQKSRYEPWAFLSSRTSGGRSSMYMCPAKDAYAWYPLHFYLDYYYIYSFNDLILKCDDGTPEEIKNKVNSKNYHIKNFYDFEKQKPLLNDNFILKSNHEVELKIKKLGLVTWSQQYTKEDVQNNFKKLNKLLNKAELSMVFNSKNSQFLLLGTAYCMTNYMRKVTEAISANVNTTTTSIS